MSNSELKKLAEKKTAQIVKSELDKKTYEDVAWLKALKKADGDEIKARALYIDLRSSDLVEEVYLSLKEDQKNRLKKGLNNDDEVDVDYSIKDGFKFKKKTSLPLTDYEKRQIKQKQIEELKDLKSQYSSSSYKTARLENNGLAYSVGKFVGGRMSLAYSFWVVLVFMQTAYSLPMIYINVVGVEKEVTGILALLFILYALSLFISNIVTLVGTWRSAGNYIRENKSSFWGYVTRVFLVFATFSYIYQLSKSLKTFFE